MNQAQAKAAFEQGQLHIHCPACGHDQIILHQVMMVNNQIYKGYECHTCRENFAATVKV